MPKHVTLADVARLAGVSKTAVSLVLNERPGTHLSAAAADRVRDAARELGYRPNPAARSLRLGSTRTVGMISDDVITTRYASALVAGALGAARDRDHTLLLAETNGDPGRIEEAVETMLDRRTDGIVVAVMAARIVELPRLPPHTRVVVANGVGARGEPSVLPAEYEAGAAVASELLAAGHRRVAVVGQPPAEALAAGRSATVGTRLSGIRDVFRRAGVEPVLRLEAREWEPEHGYDLARAALASDARVTALLCLNDRLAFGAYQALHDAGVAVPDQISVASFDDDELARHLRPGLTTAAIPYAEIGARAVTMLLDDVRPEAPVLVPMPLRRRASVAAPRGWAEGGLSPADRTRRTPARRPRAG